MTQVISEINETDQIVLPLTLLRPGELAEVDQVVGIGEVVARLVELGLRDGSQVEMIRSGSPCMIKLDGQKLGLRSEELDHVLVRTRNSSR